MRRTIKVNGGTYSVQNMEYGIGFLCTSSCTLALPSLNQAAGIDIFVLPVGDAEVTLSGPDDKSMVDLGDGNPERDKTLSGQIQYHVIAEGGKYLVFGGPSVTDKQTKELSPEATEAVTVKAKKLGRPKKEPVPIEI